MQVVLSLCKGAWRANQLYLRAAELSRDRIVVFFCVKSLIAIPAVRLIDALQLSSIVFCIRCNVAICLRIVNSSTAIS